MLAPALALLGVLFIFPVLYSGYLGFTDLALVGSRSRDYQFTGLDNVTRMLSDYVFIKSSWLTIIFVVGSAIVGQTVLGMALAILLRNALVSVRAVIGSIVIVAWVLPEITVALVWYAFSQAGGTLSIPLRCGCSGFSKTPIWSRSSRDGMLRIVNAGPTRLPLEGFVRRVIPWMNTLRKPRLNNCVHSVATVTWRSRSNVSGLTFIGMLARVWHRISSRGRPSAESHAS